ncbi:MAG: O-antigen ligase family protein [Terriglobia bacterium]|jgi:O-antigen ligase
MANNTQDCLFPSPRLPVSGEPLEGFRGHKAALASGMVGAGAAALFICGHWSIMLAGALVMFALSLVENERFILIVIFLLPVGWVLNADVPMKNVSVAVRLLLVAGFFLGRLLRGQLNGRLLFRSSITRASLLFLCAAIASNALGELGWSHDSLHSVYDLASYIAFFLMLLVWLDSRQRIRKVLWAVLFSAVVTALFAIYQQIIGGYSSLWLYLNPQDEAFDPWAGRSPSFMAQSNCLAGYLNLILPFALACYVLGQGKWKKLGGWTVGLGFVALLSTQSLGGLLAFVSILVLAIFCFARSRKKKLVLLAGICALVCLLYLLRPILNPTHTEEFVGYDALGRLVLWGAAWDIFRHSPLMGVGWGNLLRLYPTDLPAFTREFAAHNIYLQLLAETGLVGFVAFFYLVVQSGRQAWSQWRSTGDFLDRALAFGVLGALISVMVHGFVDFLFQGSQQFAALFWVVLALLVASARLRGMPVVGRVGASGAQA